VPELPPVDPEPVEGAAALAELAAFKWLGHALMILVLLLALLISLLLLFFLPAFSS
jgi:hypothetical protein